MKKRTLKKARIQLLICIPLLCIGMIAAGVLIVKNLSWAEISMAAVGILIGIFGLYGILDARNFCITYDDEEIMVRDFRRKTKKFYYQDLEGFCFQNNFEEIILYFTNGRIVLDDATKDKERFVKVAERKYTKYHCGQRIPERWERSRHTVILVVLAVWGMCMACMGIASILPPREKTEFYGQIHVEPIEHYTEDINFYMDGKEVHIAGYEEALQNKELFQEELLAGKKFKLETELAGEKKEMYYAVRYLEDEDGNVLISYYSSGKTNLFFISGLAAVILAMTVFMWRVDVNKKKYAKIYRFFFKD